MTHELPALPYEFSDLEPHIDARTMEIHMENTIMLYNNLNAALEVTLNYRINRLKNCLRISGQFQVTLGVQSKTTEVVIIITHCFGRA
ncbi:MAG: hypothetical protein CM1200mP6_00610 [Anaerolineaceae bacterium]|nr:MAG: hypothetical protein CM1200mP6_00610 [Anaerolineaceae bacterium]